MSSVDRTNDCNYNDSDRVRSYKHKFCNRVISFILAVYLSIYPSTRFIQKVPGLGGYLKKLTSFHPDISYYTFFKSILFD